MNLSWITRSVQMCETDVHAETAGDVSVCIIIISRVCELAHFQAAQEGLKSWAVRVIFMNIQLIWILQRSESHIKVNLMGTSVIINAVRVNVNWCDMNHTSYKISLFFFFSLVHKLFVHLMSLFVHLKRFWLVCFTQISTALELIKVR